MKPFYVFILILFSVYNCDSQVKIKNAESRLSTKIENKSIVSILEGNISIFPNKFQVSIAIINGDNTEYIGVIRKNDTLITINNKNSVFEIGSISKVFTSVLFSNLIHDNKISLDETLSNQFDFNLKNVKNIQLYQLANHTSGLPRLPENIMPLLATNQSNPYKYYTPKLLESYLKDDLTLQYPTGEKNVYSNLGAGLLGYILTLKSNKAYEELLKDNILKPLKMNQSYSLSIDNKNVVRGLNQNGTPASNWDFTNVFVGAGGIKSTTNDMVKFARKNFENDSIYNLPQQPTFTINSSLKMGLGWHISKDGDNEFLWHNGGTGGYRSCFAIDKLNKKGVVVLSNISGMDASSGKIDTLCFQLLKNITHR